MKHPIKTMKIALCMLTLTLSASVKAQTNRVAKFSSTTIPSGLAQTNIFDNGSSVGIGTTSPAAGNVLHVTGRARIDVTTTGAGGGRFWLTRPAASNYENLLMFGSNGTSTYDWGMGNAVSSTDLTISHYTQSRCFTISSTTGNVGLGDVIAPLAKLHVSGSAIFSTSGSPASAAYIRGNTGMSSVTTPDYTWYQDLNTGMFHPAAGTLAFTAGGVERMRISSSGILIGDPTTVTTPAGYKLYVETGILTEKVKVAVKGTSNWSDYVFAADYKLNPLNEVAAYIAQHKHLPGIPSAEEMVKEGLDVAVMDAKLLEKIEELTLYILEQNRKIEVLQSEVKELKSK